MRRSTMLKNQKIGRYTLNPYNAELRIRMVDKKGDLIQMVSQIGAFHLLRHGFCDLLMVTPPTIQFQMEREEWDEKYLRLRPPKWFREGPKYLETRKSVLYGNYHIQSPDGHEMFHCNSQKALWYLNRDIAEIVNTDPPTLRLKFKPGGPGHIGDPYYLTEKVNRCVVCGCNKELSRHHVMPRVFRRHMPETIKDHNYHDVLLLCIDCHQRYEIEADKHKQEIAQEFGITLNGGAGQLYIREVGEAAKAARALLNYPLIPLARQEFLRDRIRTYLGRQEITQEDLETCADLNAWKVNDDENYKDYGQVVVESIGDVQEFTVRWRQHFIDVMQPKYLPKHWDVEKPLVRDRVRSPLRNNTSLMEGALDNTVESPRANEPPS